MTAVDLNRGEHAWMVPNGNGDRLRNHPMLRDLDLPPLGGEGQGGPVVTKTLLISALTAGRYRTGDPDSWPETSRPGPRLGRSICREGPSGTPMTYMDGGRQYIALTVGGDIPALIALALP